MKFLLRYIRINQGGYDREGTYWGTGLRLFRYESVPLKDTDDILTDYIRAYNRDDAKRIIRQKHPGAEFYA